MQYDLIGYLTGALDPHEMRVVDEALANDPVLLRELDSLRRSIEPLDHLSIPSEEPPSSLIDRTMAALDASPPVSESPASATSTSSRERQLVFGDNHVSPRGSGLSEPQSSRGGGRRWSSLDFAGLAVAIAVLLALAIPGLNRWRESSRRIACVNQLRLLGTELTQFVQRQPEQNLPEIDRSGPEAFAGVYAIRLRDAGLMNDPSVRWCPSSAFADTASYKHTDPLKLVAASELRNQSVNALHEIQRSAGGHYAYNLGVQDGDRYGPPRFESRTSFAMLSDSPRPSKAAGSSSFSGPHFDGINVLYEDGSVSFVSADAVTSLPDHPLQNHRGLVEAGLTIDDASLGSSWRPPFADVRQR